MEQKLRIVVALILLLTIPLMIKNFVLTTGFSVLVWKKELSLFLGFFLIILAMNFSGEKSRKKPVVAIDTNVLLDAFIYKHQNLLYEYPNLSRGFNLKYAKEGHETMKLVKYGEIVGFIPYKSLIESVEVLREKYRLPYRIVENFLKDLKEMNVRFNVNIKKGSEYFSKSKKFRRWPKEIEDVVADLYNPLKGRYRAWPRKTLERICEAYVEDDADKSIIREALRHYCDAFVTSDRKLARNPTIVHYIPLFHTKNFNQTIKEGYRTRKQLEKEAFKMMNK